MLFPLPPSGLDSDMQSYVTANTTITNPTIITALDVFYKGLKSDSLWTQLTAFWPFIGGTTSTGQGVNGKTPGTNDLTFNGTGTFSSSGYQTNRTNAYGATGILPSTLGQNSAGLGFYSLTANSGGFSWDMGSENGTASNNFFIVTNFGGSTYVASQTAAAFNTSSSWVTASSGLLSIERTSSTLQTAYKNGSALGTSSGASLAGTTNQVFIGAVNPTNNNLNSSAFSNLQFAFAYISTGLSGADILKLYNRIQTLQTALSRNV